MDPNELLNGNKPRKVPSTILSPQQIENHMREIITKVLARMVADNIQYTPADMLKALDHAVHICVFNEHIFDEFVKEFSQIDRQYCINSKITGVVTPFMIGIKFDPDNEVGRNILRDIGNLYLRKFDFEFKVTEGNFIDFTPLARHLKADTCVMMKMQLLNLIRGVYKKAS